MPNAFPSSDTPLDYCPSCFCWQSASFPVSLKTYDRNALGIPCRSKKLVTERRSLARQYCSRICSREIIHVTVPIFGILESVRSSSNGSLNSFPRELSLYSRMCRYFARSKLTDRSCGNRFVLACWIVRVEDFILLLNSRFSRSEFFYIVFTCCSITATLLIGTELILGAIVSFPASPSNFIALEAVAGW